MKQAVILISSDTSSRAVVLLGGVIAAPQSSRLSAANSIGASVKKLGSYFVLNGR